ncbi:MAG: GNAT family N-acetyltransferase [Anaerolineae bacterium]
MSIADVTVEPMTEEFVVWRCLHSGPLTPDGIDVLPPPIQGQDAVSWEALRARNVPLLTRLVRTYGSCAMLAKDGDAVVGFLRFYPKAVAALPGTGLLCLQQRHPNGPAESLADEPLPPLEAMDDRTLVVHCLMTGSPQQEHNPYQRRGLAARMVQELVRWGRDRGWQAIEATAYEDIDVLYAITGQAGRRFWEKLGFETIEKGSEPIEGWPEGLLSMVRAQAEAAGLTAADATNRYTMRLCLR